MLEKLERTMAEKLKAVVVNFWTATHPKLDGKTIFPIYTVHLERRVKRMEEGARSGKEMHQY